MLKTDVSFSDEQLALTPVQPDEVVRAVGELLRTPAEDVDPWWQAGLGDALGDDPISSL
jgi:hypothetical protein